MGGGGAGCGGGGGIVGELGLSPPPAPPHRTRHAGGLWAFCQLPTAGTCNHAAFNLRGGTGQPWNDLVLAILSSASPCLFPSDTQTDTQTPGHQVLVSLRSRV